MSEPIRNRCNVLLTALIGKEYVAQWWDSPNKRFDGETPNKVFETEPNRVYNYLMEFVEGAW
jgi:hypothetical protein